MQSYVFNKVFLYTLLNIPSYNNYSESWSILVQMVTTLTWSSTVLAEVLLVQRCHTLGIQRRILSYLN